MLEKKLCYKARSDITALTLLKDESLGVSTKLHGIKIFSVKECIAKKNLSIELLGYKTTAIAFSEDTSLIAIANQKIIYIVSTQNKLLLQTIKTNDGIIELLTFVPNSKYLIAGTKHGRVVQYRYDGRSQLSRLCSFGQNSAHKKMHIKNNYVSAFAFHKKTFACSGYGGVITILKMDSYINRVIINASKVRINALCFINKSTIASANVDGLVQIHSLKKYQSTKNIDTPFRNIQQIILMPNQNFLMISGQDTNIVLIDIKLAKVVSTAYMSFQENVDKIILHKNNELLVSLQNREIYKIALPSTEEIKTHILNNDIGKAYELIENDPMLQGTREHKRVEVMYENMYMKAISALIQTNTKEARQLMKMFNDIPSKQKEVNSIFKAFEYYPRFKILCNNNKYSLAYAMAENHPALRHTQQYKKMEESFKENFSFAQKQILMGRLDIAKEILHPYITSLSKKPLIDFVILQNADFLLFLKAMQNKNYKVVEKLIKKNALFSKIPSYVALKKVAQTTLDSIEKLIQKSQIPAAIEKIKEALKLPDIQEELKYFYQECIAIQKLTTAYEEKNLVLCYEIIDANRAVESTKLAQELESQWETLLNKCESAALKGDIKSIKQHLGALIHVKTRVDKIGDLLRVSFQIKIKALIAKKRFTNAQNIIYSYIDTFGLDSELIFLMKIYEKLSQQKLAITISSQKQVARNSWLHSSVIMKD